MELRETVGGMVAIGRDIYWEVRVGTGFKVRTKLVEDVIPHVTIEMLSVQNSLM